MLDQSYVYYHNKAWITATRFPLDDFRSFNSPLEVLFNFPSGYLFAIDLSPIFSHGWRLPPCLRSTPKERDSFDHYRTKVLLVKNGTITLCGVPFQAPSTRRLLGNDHDVQLKAM